MKHIFTLQFPVETDETDSDHVDITQLIDAAQNHLNKIKKNRTKHLADFDFVESQNETE